MAPDQKELLTLRVLPARVTSDQVAYYLGFQPHDIPILTARGMIKPLGTPAATAQKYYASVELERLRVDVKWISRATAAIHQYWQAKNNRKKNRRTLHKETGDGVGQNSP